MTKPCYPSGCAARSQVGGDASENAWYVNLHNGNVNNNNRNNSGYVLGCRLAPASECHDAVGFDDLVHAWKQARRHKRPSVNQLRFETRWIDELFEILDAINTGTWSPRPSTCFVARSPKAREIHAPDFADRVVHHLVVPRLEPIYERMFIHDSYANRAGKGTHAAVRRLQAFTRQVQSGQGGGWYLQLDIANFFYCINRRILWQLVRDRMQRHNVAEAYQRIVHALLRQHPTAAGVKHRCAPPERALVPRHKQLANAARDCGLPIGNLSSQFLANVYLNELDQFVKHQLNAQRYLRYVDDFVLIHHDRQQLVEWQQRIEAFLADRLALRLKAEIKLAPLTQGIDFLGYVVRPTHTLVRKRVVQHAREKLFAWQQQHVDTAGRVTATTAQRAQIRTVIASYAGHFHHANAYRLRADFRRRNPWLAQL
jgi:RNA-directed DNA polymerase